MKFERNRATGRHLPCGITLCCLLPHASERAVFLCQIDSNGKSAYAVKISRFAFRFCDHIKLIKVSSARACVARGTDMPLVRSIYDATNDRHRPMLVFRVSPCGPVDCSASAGDNHSLFICRQAIRWIRLCALLTWKSPVAFGINHPLPYYPTHVRCSCNSQTTKRPSRIAKCS